MTTQGEVLEKTRVVTHEEIDDSRSMHAIYEKTDINESEHGLLVIDSRRQIRFLDQQGKRLLHLLGREYSLHVGSEPLWSLCEEMIERFRRSPAY